MREKWREKRALSVPSTLRGVRADHGGDASPGDRAAHAVAQYPRPEATLTHWIS